MRIVELIDERRRGKRTDLAPIGAKSDRSSEDTASIIGITHRKVERTCTVLDYADEDTKQEILEGKKSIHKAYMETQERQILLISNHSATLTESAKINLFWFTLAER
jgi:hypothetical protein